MFTGQQSIFDQRDCLTRIAYILLVNHTFEVNHTPVSMINRKNIVIHAF